MLMVPQSCVVRWVHQAGHRLRGPAAEPLHTPVCSAGQGRENRPNNGADMPCLSSLVSTLAEKIFSAEHSPKGSAVSMKVSDCHLTPSSEWSSRWTRIFLYI